MKPIFEKERKFLEEHLGVVIPKYCWRTTKNEVFFSAKEAVAKEKPFLKFKIEEGNSFVLSYYDPDKIIDENHLCVLGFKVPVETWDDEYFFHKQSILEKEKESLLIGKAFLARYPNAEIRVGVSGGKDSQVCYHLLEKIESNFYTDYFNTSNETADTYKFVKYPDRYKNLTIHNPKIGMHTWLKEVKNDFLPSRTVRNCCQVFKEDQLLHRLDKSKEYVLVVGVRKDESTARSYYDFDLNKSVIERFGEKKLNVPLNFHRLALIVNWTDVEIWLYILYHGLPVNRMYELGFNRVGCTMCFNQTDYIDVLVKTYYHSLWKKWEVAIRRNYHTQRIERLNWTESEWLHKWKDGVSKEYHLLRLKPTSKRIAQVAAIKGISFALAEKFFQRKCCCCKTKTGNSKLLNSTEISMNLKFFGRQESLSIDQELNRPLYCKTCMCHYMGWSKNDYKHYVDRFLNDGCELFVNKQ